MAEEHKRRVHYSGKYPKRYEEKYKELNSDRYDGISEHVTDKGNTPAGTHIPIMVDEIMEFLDIRPGMIGCDCTLGYGGHTTKILEKLDGKGHLYCFDIDPIESAKTEARLNEKGFEGMFTVVHQNYSTIDEIASKFGPFDFILADLGVSSMQIDNPERGFTYKFEGPLDLRMDPTVGVPAYEKLMTMTRQDIEDILVINSDEPYAKKLSQAIFTSIKAGEVPDTTTKLRHIVESALEYLPLNKKDKKAEIKKSLSRVFQALRIDINCEFENLEKYMSAIPMALKPDGKIAVLTFHSGEDRIVKLHMKGGFKDGTYSSYARYVERPTPEECAKNPRSTSAKLRWAVRSDK